MNGDPSNAWALEPARPEPQRTPHAQRAFETHRRAILSDPRSSVLAKHRVNQNFTLDELAAATEVRSPYTGDVLASVSARTLKRAEAGDPSVSDESWNMIARALRAERRFLDSRFV